MKLRALFICLISVFAFAATPPPSPVTTVTMLGCNPTFNTDGSLATAPMQALFQTSAVVDDQKLTGSDSVAWDGTDRKKTVSFDGINASYYQVTMLAAAIANHERAAQAAAAAAKAKAKAKPAAP